MIEIPESLVLAEQLNKTVNGKKIVSVETEHTEHKFAWYEGDPQKYDEKMAGHVPAPRYSRASAPPACLCSFYP